MARKLQPFNEFQVEYFQERPEEIASYIEMIFEEYGKDGDTGALLSALRIIAQAKGIRNLASETGLTRQGIQLALSDKGNPRLDNINAIMHSLGFRLKAEKIESARAH